MTEPTSLVLMGAQESGNDPQSARQVLLAALAAAGISRVAIYYDGEGDQGQINGIDAYDAANVFVALDQPPLAVLALSEKLDDFAWTALDRHHAGFVNNDGGYGTIRINVVTGEIFLDHYDRWIETSNTETEL